MKDPAFSMLGMEEELKKDIHGTYAKNIQDRLYQYLTQAKTVLNSGLSPDEFAREHDICKAIEASIKVVKLTHEGFHRGNQQV